MLARDEALRSLYGAWRIARLDPQAMSWFDQSAEGFWNSFYALPLALAPYLVATLIASSGDAVAANGGPVSFLALQALDFAVSWIGFLLLMLPVSWGLGLTVNYPSFVIASNWASLLVMALLVPAQLLIGGDSGPQPERAAVMLATAVGITMLFYSYLVARAALRSGVLASVGVVLIELAVTMLVNALVDRLAVALFPGAPALQ